MSRIHNTIGAVAVAALVLANPFGAPAAKADTAADNNRRYVEHNVANCANNGGSWNGNHCIGAGPRHSGDSSGGSAGWGWLALGFVAFALLALASDEAPTTPTAGSATR